MMSDKLLKELSFEVIRKNFSRFTTAYPVSKDETLKMNLCFLQRVYTRTLFLELEKNKELKEEHFDFLLNEHLRKLDIGVLLNCSSAEKTLEKVIPIAHSLLELSCYPDYRYEEDTVKIFEKLIPVANNVEYISIPYCNDKLIQLISANCPNLTELDIEKTNSLTSTGIRRLCSNPDGLVLANCPLKRLKLPYTETKLTVEDIAFLLKNVPTLEEVLYHRLPEAVESIHSVEAIDIDIDNNIVPEIQPFNLQTLDFMYYYDSLQISKLLEICTKWCQKLKKLSVPILSNTDIELLGRFPNLENLSIMPHVELEMLDLNSFFIEKGKNLKVLIVDSCSISVSTLVESCPNLESLTLKNIAYQHIDKNTTKVLNKLGDLHLESITSLDYHCADSMMMLLNSSPNLISLSLHYCDFSDLDIVARLSTFSLNCNLSHLQFDYSDVGVDLLQLFIMNSNSIKSVSVDNCENISWEDISMLNQTIEASNRKISINFTDNQSNLSYSDYEVDYYDGYDAFDDYHGYDFDDDEDDYDDEYDTYDDLLDQDFW